MKFTKMQSFGNDYVYIELLTQEMKDPARYARFLSKQHFGVGSDGMILICPSDKADFRMRVFNPDGSEAEICGNAIRSVGKLVYAKGFTNKTEILIETLGGTKEISLHVKNGEVENITAKWGSPILEPKRIPISENSGIEHPLTAHDRVFYMTSVSMGNPHSATFVDDAETLDLKKYGASIECNPFFPEKANIEFVKVLDRKNLFLRTWERNCGETLACGTGCCVSTVAGVLTGRCDREVNVHQLGGITKIRWEEKEDCLYMTAPSEIVFDGVVPEGALEKFEKNYAHKGD